MSPIELEDPLGCIVQKIAIMRHRHHRARKAQQELLEPFDALGIEVIGRFVEQQHVGLGQEQAAERDAAFFTAGKLFDLRVPRSQAQRVGRDLHLHIGVRAPPRDDGLKACLFGRELVEVGVGLGIRGVDFLELLLGVKYFAQALLDRLAHCLFGSELRLLRQIADAHAGHRHRFALVLLVLARHDAQQARLSRAVDAEDADLGAGKER